MAITLKHPLIQQTFTDVDESDDVTIEIDGREINCFIEGYTAIRAAVRPTLRDDVRLWLQHNATSVRGYPTWCLKGALAFGVVGRDADDLQKHVVRQDVTQAAHQKASEEGFELHFNDGGFEDHFRSAWAQFLGKAGE